MITEVTLTAAQFDPLYLGMMGMALSLKIIMTSTLILLFLQTAEVTFKGVSSWKRG